MTRSVLSLPPVELSELARLVQTLAGPVTPAASVTVTVANVVPPGLLRRNDYRQLVLPLRTNR